MSNQFTGDIDLKMGDRSLVICYDWEAIGQLITELGKDFDKKISSASMEYDLSVMAIVLSIGLKKHHPGEFSPETIMQLSPPVILIIETIDRAMSVAFNGGMEVSAEQAENPKNPVLRYLKRILWDWWRKP